MRNIQGSEVHRCISWKNKNNPEYAQLAFKRSLELFDLTKGSKLTAPQYKELLRTREMWVDFFSYDNAYNSTGESINKYFTELTVAFKNLQRK